MYLLMRDTQREAERHREREKQAPCRELDAGLDAGLDPRTPGSHPEPKVDAQPLSYPGTLAHFLSLYFSAFPYVRLEG